MLVVLANQVERKRLELQIAADVDTYCKQAFSEPPRTHLGASVIGDDCHAKAWNAFRFLKFEDFDGRMLRLFNRGHLEEPRFVRWLEGIGFEIHEIDPETKKQFRILGAKGHFGGSLDAMMKAPARYNVGNLIFLGEFKTHNQKQFDKLKKDGVQLSKPMHYSQMCAYGRAYGFEYGVYCAVNKNDDELYIKILKLDWNKADDLFRKAESIVNSQVRPHKIAQTDSYFDCRMCHFAGICHRGEVPTKNCRSCRHAFPVENAEWFCEVHKGNIPKDFILQGCDSYARIA